MVLSRRSTHDAALAKIDVRELRVRIGEIDLHRTRHRGPSSPHFGKRILESVGDIYPGAMLGAGDRIFDGFTASLGNAAHD